MMEARKLLINLLYRATSQSSELPGWSHRETKNPPLAGFLLLASCGDVVAIGADGDHRQEQHRREQDQDYPSGYFDGRHQPF